MSSGELGLLLAVVPGRVFVVVGSVFQAAVEVANEAVRERAEGLVVEIAFGSLLVIEGPASGAGL